MNNYTLDELSDLLLCGNSSIDISMLLPDILTPNNYSLEFLSNTMDSLSIRENPTPTLIPILDTPKKIISKNNKTIGIIGNDGLLYYLEIYSRRCKDIDVNSLSEPLEKRKTELKTELKPELKTELKPLYRFQTEYSIQLSENPKNNESLYTKIQSSRGIKKRANPKTFQVSLENNEKPKNDSPKILFIKIKDNKEKTKTFHKSYGNYNKLSIDKWRINENICEEDELEDLYYEDDEEDIDSINLYQKDIRNMYQRKSQAWSSKNRY